MLARIARQLGDRLARALELPQEAADRAAYALEILFLYILTLAAIALPAFVLGLFWPAMAATLTAGAMRSVSGGAHLNSPWRCIVLSTLVAVFFGLIGHLLISNVTVLTLGILTGIIVVMGTVIILRYCPADTPAKPIPPTKRMLYKYTSLVLLLLWGILLVVLPLGIDLRCASLLGMIWQIISLTPIGFQASHSLEKLWQKEVKRDA